MEVREINVGDALREMEPLRLASSESEVKKAVDYIQGLKNSLPESIDYDELKKIIEEITPKLKEVGLFLSFEKIGDVPIVKVKDISGKVIKTFPREEVAELIRRIKIFFDVLTDLLLSRKI